MCADVGPVFNPLQDPHMDSTTEDPGTLNTHYIGSTTDANDYSMSSLMQNLGGKNNIIGRSIVFTYRGSEDGCCVIGLAGPPAPTILVYAPHYHTTRHYGYGGYGHQGHH